MVEGNPLHVGLSSVIHRVSTESALSPLIWVFGLVATADVAAATVHYDVLVWLFSSIVGFDFLAILIAYAFFMLKKPDMLQSEGYQLSAQRISLLKDERFKGNEDLIEKMSTNDQRLQIGNDQ